MIVLLGLFAAASLGTATARDIEALKADARSAADRVSSLEARMVDLEAEERDLAAEMEAVGRELASAELATQRAMDEFDRAQAGYIEQAVAAYKMGESADLALLLSSATMDEAFALAEVASRRATDASESIVELGRARKTAEDAQAGLDERKVRLAHAKARAENVARDLRSNLLDRRARLRELSSEIKTLEEKARRAAEEAARKQALTTSRALMDILGPAGPSKGLPKSFVGTGVVIEGVASWYGPGFEGNLTANGDIFDSSLYTVASKELPFGTWLYVEHEGRGVIVLVNDRGPYVGDRILDLSRAAAEAIGIGGIGWVRAEVVLKV
jgi:rare lipoprotein A (peptidoglycan hydrolase)